MGVDESIPEWRCVTCKHYRRDYCKVLRVATSINGYCNEYYEPKEQKKERKESRND